MIDAIQPSTRQKLVEYRCAAMRGNLLDSLTQLQALLRQLLDLGNVIDGVSIAMLSAELMHLHDEDAKGAEYFDSSIVPLLSELSTEGRIIADYNRSQFDFALMRPAPYWYSLAERSKEVGLELFDTRSLFFASEAVADGKHYDALPGFWREFVRTHRQECWHASYWAAARLGREHLQIGLPQEAVWYAVYGLDEKVAKSATTDLLNRRDPIAIRGTIKNLIANANLNRHFSLACTIITGISDSIPDDLIEEIGTWLLSRCKLPKGPRLASGPLSQAWKALGSIGHRLSIALARSAVEVAVSHPKLTTPINGPDQVVLEREDIVGALDHVVDVLPSEDLRALAGHALPLAMDRRLNHDYDDVVNLLCHIAQSGTAELRKYMGDQLFVQGQPRSYLLGQVASIFEKQFLSPERLANAADAVAEMIRLQVQRIPEGQEAKEYPGRPMRLIAVHDGGQIVVNIPSGVELEAVSRQRGDLSQLKVSDLVHAILDLVRDRENLLVNRVGLVRGLASFADCLTDTLADESFAVLQPLARGAVEEPTSVAPAAEAENPLNRFRAHMGRPADLRGAALVAVARIEAARPSISRGQLEDLLEEALADFDSDVRRNAFIAAQITPRLSEGAIMAVLQGLRDQDPYSAAAAFYVLCQPGGIRVTRPQWHLFLYASKMAAQSPSRDLRVAAASAVCEMGPKAPSESLRAKLMELEAVFVADISFAVRERCAEIKARLR